MTWHTRRFGTEPDDERGIKYLWLKSHAYSSYGRRMRLVVAERVVLDDGRDRLHWHEHDANMKAYWRGHEPVVTRLLARCGADILYNPAAPDVILAFACQEDGAVHMAVRKRKFREFAAAMFGTLLGHHTRDTVYTHEMPDLAAEYDGKMPEGWRYDEFWLVRNL